MTQGAVPQRRRAGPPVKAKRRAKEEFDRALAETGLSEDEFRARVKASRRCRSPFRRPAHRVAGIAANLVYAVA